MNRDVYFCGEHGIQGGTLCGTCFAQSAVKVDDVTPEEDAAWREKFPSESADPVNHPSHYQLFPNQEAIDVIEATLTPEEFAGYCKGNFLKYRLRAGEKGDTQQDIDKSNWYRNRLNGR